MNDNYQLFNLETMSGVFPGARTVVFQRLRVYRVADRTAAPRWVKLSWFDDPPACVAPIPAPETAPPQSHEAIVDESHSFVRLANPAKGDLLHELGSAFAEAGWQVRTCGACRHWQPAAAVTADGLPTGFCTWRDAGRQAYAAAPALAAQSALALECTHWSQAAGEKPISPLEDTGSVPAIDPIPRRAEQETDERWSWWGRLRRMVFAESRRARRPAADRRWEETIVERSGVGAGTEACFACHGRIANLGALAVATPEGDKQTFSVWRCRSCYTYYLNDWIDRWERTDTLETEETYYRIAPAEALELLAVFENVVHAEHPARRHERDAQRQWVLRFIGSRKSLSHQVRQGR